jgi:cellulose synthase (UDP-forming)
MRLRRNKSNTTVKRQWGAEKRTQPLSNFHDYPSTRKIALSRAAVVITVLLWALYFVLTVIRQFFEGHTNFAFTMEAIGYLATVTVLMFSSLLYLITRQGALQRFSTHLRVPRAELEEYFSKNKSKNITVLVPSYSEEPQVVRKTLLSAAMQEYPGMRVVLLLDDNPNPKSQDAKESLEASRNLAKDILSQLSEPREKAKAAFSEAQRILKNHTMASDDSVIKLIYHYKWTAKWLEEMAASEERNDHVDEFFINQVILEQAKELRLVTEALAASLREQTKLPASRILQIYERLTWIFDFDIEVFERKQFASLSHESNKAMNLNSYIGLMGGNYQIRQTHGGTILKPIEGTLKADLIVPDTEYLLTLDADSILLKEYCLRLVYFLEQPGNERVAVTQTPYSSFRGASTRIERLAGATTDIQHILHQGMSYYNATFWVGANAVIRKIALEDIVETEWVGGFQIKRYVQDRTVIEDTESSIDLTLHGWTLVNYPERLSYSATPPDFGSLIVQRRRWANGGLLILPKLWAQTKQRKQRQEVVSRMEIMLRTNYMASIAWASFGLIFLLAFPYSSRLLSPLIIFASVPYFLAMASDLHYCGYKRTDIFRIYGFNFILLPVNIAGVLKSVQQALSGKKIPFARTPKVKNRTAASWLYVVAPFAIVAFSLHILYNDEQTHNWINAAFAAFNSVVTMWAIIAYIGIWNAISDIWHSYTSWLYVEVKPKRIQDLAEKEPIDWRAVLYHGDAEQALPLSLADYESAAEEGATI